MTSMWRPKTLFAAILQLSTIFSTPASAKDLDGGELDNAGSHRITYQLAILGAQDGQEQALIHNPAFEKRCNNDRDCHLALRGMAASVAKKSLTSTVLPCPGKKCDTGDLVSVYSQMYARSAMDSFTRTSLLSRFYGSDGNITPKWSDDDLNVIFELDKWLEWASPDESKLKRHRNHWMKKMADAWFEDKPAASPAKNATAAVRGSVFIESVYGGETCVGDSYLCPVGADQKNIVKPVLAVLWGMSTNDKGEKVLHKNNPLRHSIDRFNPRIKKSPYRALEEMLKGAKKKAEYRKYAKPYAEKFVKFAQMNKNAAKDMLFEGMRYTTEVFDPQHARIWHSNLRLDTSRALDPGLVALGYAPLIAMDDTGFPMLGHEQTRIASDLMPVTGGDWLVLTVDRADAPNATSTHGRRSLQDSMTAPLDPHWHVPAEGGLKHGHSSLSRRDITASPDGFLPDLRVFQVLVTDSGGALVNSIGLPMIRAVDAIDGQLATNPVIQSIDATPIEGGTSSVMAIRINGAKGNPIQLGDALQFRLDRRSLGGNKVGKSASHAQFPDNTRLTPTLDASSKAASRFHNRYEAKIFERWVFEKIQNLKRVIKTNNREIAWVQQELNTTDSPTTISRLKKLQGANEDAAAVGQKQISNLEAFAKAVDKDFTEELWLGDTPQTMRQLLQSERNIARHGEISHAKRSEFFVLENYGEGVASKEVAELIEALEANDSRGFELKQLMSSRAVELLWYAGLGSQGSSSCHVQTSQAKSRQARTVKPRPNDVLPTIGEDEIYARVSLEDVVKGNVDPATVPPEKRTIFPESGGRLRHSGSSIGQPFGGSSSRWKGATFSGPDPYIDVSTGLEVVEGAPEGGFIRPPGSWSSGSLSPASGVSVESLPAVLGDAEIIPGAEIPTGLAAMKVPYAALGWSAAAVFMGFSIAQQVIELTAPDKSCPRPAYRTEMWNAEAAAQTTLRSPCTHTDENVWFPTATALETMTVAFGLPEVTGGFGFSVNDTSGAQRREISIDSTSDYNTAKDEVQLEGTKAGTAAAAATDAPTPAGSNTPPNISECPTKTLADDQYVWVMVPALPCPVPTPRECSVQWFREHVNDLPPNIRAPNYCFNGDLVGHARAVEHGCFPDYKSFECQREFGLDKQENEKKLEEAKTKAQVAEDELDAQIKAHFEEEEKEKKKE